MNENPRTDPTDTPTDQNPTSEQPPKNQDSVRDRTVRHLRRLLTAGAVGGVAMQLTGCTDGCGPIVCDPLPPPISCDSDLASSTEVLTTVRAEWTQSGADDAVAVDVGDALFTRNLTFAADPVLTGGTLVSSEITEAGQALRVTVLPDDGATSISVTITVGCDGQNRVLSYSLDISGGPGSTIPVSLAE